MKWSWLGVIVSASILFGAILGPLAIAALGSAFQDQDELSEWIEAAELADRYRDAQPRLYYHLSIALAEPVYEQCGYDLDVLFPNLSEDMSTLFDLDHYSHYEGAWVIDQLQSQNNRDIAEHILVNALKDRLSGFELGFLRRCVDATLFSDTCLARVSQIASSIPNGPDGVPPIHIAGAGDEQEIACTFLDGLAARSGVPLSDRG